MYKLGGNQLRLFMHNMYNICVQIHTKLFIPVVFIYLG